MGIGTRIEKTGRLVHLRSSASHGAHEAETERVPPGRGDALPLHHCREQLEDRAGPRRLR